METKMSNEFATVDIHRAMDALGEIIGITTPDDILENVFASSASASRSNVPRETRMPTVIKPRIIIKSSSSEPVMPVSRQAWPLPEWVARRYCFPLVF